MDNSKQIKKTAPSIRARFTRVLASVLIHYSFFGSSKLLRNAYKLLGRPPHGKLRIDTRHGFEMMVNPRENKGVDASIYFNGTYESGTIHAITNSLRQGDVFIDAGANIGLMSLAAAQKVGKNGMVYAFEPIPDVLAQLKQNIQINNFKNIEVIESALGSNREHRPIYEQQEINRGSASLVKPESNVTATHSISVETLDNFCVSINKKPIRMIKADVEGWELEVLSGGQKLLASEEAPILCVEYSISYSPRKEQLHDVYNFIRNINNYQFFKLKNGKETISPLVKILNISDLPKHDNIFCFLPHQIAEIGPALFS